MCLCSSLFWHFYWIRFVTISLFVGSDLISPNNMLICHFLMRWNETEHKVLKWSCNSIWWRGSKWGEVMEFMGNEVIAVRKIRENLHYGCSPSLPCGECPFKRGRCFSEKRRFSTAWLIKFVCSAGALEFCLFSLQKTTAHSSCWTKLLLQKISD